MRNLLLIAVLLYLAAVPDFAGGPDACSTDVLPDGAKDCHYRHIEYASFSYSGGELSVRWPNKYSVEDVRLAKNWKRMFAYEPGSSVQVELSPKARYDLVARFTDRQTGETFLGITPVSCQARLSGRRGRTLIPAPPGGCNNDANPRSCTVKTDVDCTDDLGNPAGTVAVECSGDTGTCSDGCSDTETACCTATRTISETSGDGTQTSTTTIQEQQQGCE
jgi:hypothetical protein